MDPVAVLRELLQRFFDSRVELERLGERHAAGEFDDRELGRRSDALDAEVADVWDELYGGPSLLDDSLPEVHAIALRRYREALRIHEEYEDAFLLHATFRALEELGIGLGILSARWLRARREPERAEAERRWGALARRDLDEIANAIERTADAIADRRNDDLFPWLDPARRFLDALVEDERGLVPRARGPCRAAASAVRALMADGTQRSSARRILRRALAELDAIPASRR